MLIEFPRSPQQQQQQQQGQQQQQQQQRQHRHRFPIRTIRKTRFGVLTTWCRCYKTFTAVIH
jgi:hypothetical protein